MGLSTDWPTESRKAFPRSVSQKAYPRDWPTASKKVFLGSEMHLAYPLKDSPKEKRLGFLLKDSRSEIHWGWSMAKN